MSAGRPGYSHIISVEIGDVIKQSCRCNQVATCSGGKRPGKEACASDVRAYGRRRGCHQGSEGREDAIRALSSRPFCPYDSRPGEPVVFLRRVQVHGQKMLSWLYSKFCSVFPDMYSLSTKFSKFNRDFSSFLPYQ